MDLGSDFTIMRFTFLIFITLLVELYGATVAYSSGNEEYQLYLTNRIENNQPSSEKQDKFDCSDRIYLVLEARNLPLEKHELTVRWLDPEGDQQELTQYEFNGLSYTRVWAWLQLHGPTSAVIGKIFDQSFGMEDFIGQWVVIVLINKKKIGELEFNILC